MAKEFSHFNVIEIPINSGQPQLGVCEGSHKIWEELQIALNNSEVEYTHERMEDMVIDSEMITHTILPGARAPVRNAELNGEANSRVSERIVSKVGEDSLTLALGGDHSLALGTVYGHAENLHDRGHEIAVLWIDAHSDINIPEESGSGNLHGMPMGFLANGSNQNSKPHRIPGHAWIKDPRVQLHNLAYIGLRDVDSYERELLKKENILSFYMKDVKRLGMAEVMRQVFKKFKLGPKKKLHLSFDIDAMDPSVAPSTGTPVSDGLNLDEGLAIMKAVYDNGHLELIDMVEVNPTLGDDDDAKMTVGLSSLLLQVAMGITSLKDAKYQFYDRFDRFID